jgi:hypothetical protein
MGGKLGKTSHASISSYNLPQENDTQTNCCNDQSTTHDNRIQTVKKDKEKKKREKSMSTCKADKSTSTDGEIIAPSSSTIKYLIGQSSYAMHDSLSYDTLEGHVNGNHLLDSPSKDVLELRDACVRRGIISPECHSMHRLISYEDEQSRTNVTLNTCEPPMIETIVEPMTETNEDRNEQEQIDT